MLVSMAFGVAGVMVVVAITEGLRTQQLARVMSSGINSVEIEPRSDTERKDRPLTTQDARLLADRCPVLATVAPYVNQPAVLVMSGPRYVRADLMGTSEQLCSYSGLHMAMGRVFTAAENRDRSLVCVLGAELRHALFDGGDPCGARVQLVYRNRLRLTVVGALQPTGWRGIDAALYLPLATAQYRVLQRGERIDGIIAYTRSLGEVTPGAEATRTHFRKLQRPVAVSSQLERIREEMEQFDKLEHIILMLAAGALLVGGVGILKVMLAVVTGRRGEIGLRKAVGASWRDIMLQFSLEAGALGVVGAASGVILGLGGVKLAETILPWKPVMPPQHVLMACLSAIVVALLSGTLPAKHAADVSPIEALRQV